MTKKTFNFSISIDDDDFILVEDHIYTTREILKREELNMEIVVHSHLITVDYDYPDFSISLNTFLCHSNDKDLQLLEHVDYQWLTIDELTILDWAAADLPIVDELQRK